MEEKPLQWEKKDFMSGLNKKLIQPLEEIRKALIEERKKLIQQANDVKQNG
jgi:hypothetical protein